MLIWRNIFSYVVFIFVRLLYISIISASPIECPGKDVNEIRQRAQQYELSFLFYHVPWSDDSRIARKVYDQIANYYWEDIYFATIDCYHLACNCSKTHSSLGSGTPNKWPTLIVQYGQRVNVQYNGDWSSTALHIFIDNLFMPVERLHSRKELKEMRMGRDAVVLGLFTDPSQTEFRKFVSAGVKWLESDPEATFRFAATFGKSVNIILDKVNNTNQTQSQILLITSKDIVRFPNDWNVSNIVSWLKSKFVQSVNTLYGYNSPKNLATQLQLSPVLVVLANDYFYEYMYNLTNPEMTINDPCSKNSLHGYMFVLKELGYVMNAMNNIKLYNPNTCYVKEYVSLWNLHNYYGLNTYLKRRMCHLSDSCDNKDVVDLSIKKITKCIRGNQFNSQRWKISAAKYIKKFVDTNWIDFKSHQNQSLSVVILDESKHIDFLQIMGIKEANIKSFVTMIIADRLKENIFLSQDIFSYDTLQDFVRSYYNNSLISYKRSSYFKPNPEAPLSKVFIENVNSEIFMKRIEQSNLTTILLLYSPQCSFSALASQALIQLSALLDDSSGIQIIRINTLSDELQWEFKIDKTPTLIVFPRGRSADSRAFPMNLKLDVRNILSFALAQMEPLDQLKALLSCCKRQKLHSLRMRKCLQYIKTIVDVKGRKIDGNAIYADQIVEWSDVNLQLKTIFPLY
uniref:Thioredoxin domain-containing protein 11 n=2 Tax=Zeugodacus cucurbitae TaxID=28588 RepID=A0A0A1XMF9_ZEUCU